MLTVGDFLAPRLDIMEYSLSQISPRDRRPIIDLFNHYIEHSFAAYPENAVPYEAFDIVVGMSQGYPSATVKDDNGTVVGFGFLHAHNPLPAFSHTAEVTYFISPAHTGKGIGTTLLRYLEDEARKLNIRNILATVSSLNPRSIAFHKKNGFSECGRFKKVGRKKGRTFDTVWMQKAL